MKGAESRPRAIAKLCNNAGNKPILPSILKPPIATAKPANLGAVQRANIAFRRASSAAYDPARRTRPSAWRRRFPCADTPPSPPRGAAFYLAIRRRTGRSRQGERSRPTYCLVTYSLEFASTIA